MIQGPDFPQPSQTELSRVSIIAEGPERRQEEVQLFLNNPNFQKALNAHRIFDLQRHVSDLYKSVPDQSPPSDVIGDLTGNIQNNRFELSADQLEALGKALDAGKDFVSRAWLFIASKELLDGPEEEYGIRAGHVMKNVLPNKVYEKLQKKEI